MIGYFALTIINYGCYVWICRLAFFANIASTETEHESLPNKSYLYDPMIVCSGIAKPQPFSVAGYQHVALHLLVLGWDICNCCIASHDNVCWNNRTMDDTMHVGNTGLGLG